MKRLKNLIDKCGLGMVLGFASVEAFAQAQQLDLSNISGTSGAGTRQITDLTKKTNETANAIVNTVLVVAALAGVVLICGSVWGIYKASKEDRESPKVAIVGIFVGAAMTMISVLVGIFRNFYAS